MSTIGRRCLSLAAVAIGLTLSCCGAPDGISGEVVETYCWAVHHVGGPGHAQCGIDCAKHGLPVALYDTASRRAYILLPGRDRIGLPQELVAAMGQRVTIRGETITQGGIPFLVVDSWQHAHSSTRVPISTTRLGGM